jgi:hypothetical protein
MKNNLMKFAQKILFQDKILKILTTLILAAPPIILTIWCVIHEATAIDLQLILFKFSVIYLIAFMFLSYEYIYKLKSNSLIECVDTTPKGTKSIIKSKISLLCAVASVQTLVLILINVFFAISEGSLTLQYLLYIIVSILLNIFLICIAGIFIGSFSALKMKKIPAYLLMIFITIMTSRILDILWLALYTTTNIDIFKITGLFELTTPSTNWTPNTAFGYSMLPYRFAAIIFWIIIFTLGIILSLHKINKRKIKSVVCIILSIICIMVYYMPSSKVIMDQRNIDGPNADYEYYTKHEDDITIEKNNFNITDLSMEISTNLMLKAKVVIKVDNKNLEKYKFTLYHGYNIQNIKINGEDAEFNRKLDYFEINNNKHDKIDAITINYNGYSSRYYSNVQGSILPGFLPFYPMAGYQEVYDLNYQSFVPNHSDVNINFDVKVSSMKQFYSNLNENDKNHFSGNSKSLTLISGLYKTITIEDIRVVYPYPDVKELSKNNIEKYIKNFKASNIDNNKIKTIIILPSLNQGEFETVYSDNNYIISRWVVDIQDDYVKSLISKHKLELYYCIDAFENDNEYYQETKDYFNFTILFEENLKKYDKTVFYEECNKYLYDSDDERTIDEFLKDLLEVKQYA